MAKIYKAVQGRPIQEWLGRMDGVQGDLESRTFEAAVRAEEQLIKHRFQGHAAIEVDHGDIDWYVTLSDERGQKAAMSIEYGRQAYEVEREDREGNTFTVEIPAMDGLFILHRAFRLGAKKRGRVKFD